MKSILCSNIESLSNYQEYLKKYVKKDAKVLIIPWSFSNETNNLDEYFGKDTKRYLKYINVLLSLGYKENNIKVLDCYKNSKNKIKDLINTSDVIVLTGGNPEMFYQKVVQDTECLYDLKYFKGLVIGSSAGAVLQFKRYFITAKNNYYKYFSFYDGFGLINDPFYIDVHSINNNFYLKKLSNVAKDKKKKIYAISNNGVLVVDRLSNNIEYMDNVKVIN